MPDPKPRLKDSVKISGGNADEVYALKRALGIMDDNQIPLKEINRLQIGQNLPQDAYAYVTLADKSKGLANIDPNYIRRDNTDYIRNLIGVLAHEDTHLQENEFKNIDPNARVFTAHDSMGADAWKQIGPQRSVSTVRPLISRYGDSQKSTGLDEGIVRRPNPLSVLDERFSALIPPKKSENDMREEYRRQREEWERSFYKEMDERNKIPPPAKRK